MSLREDPCAQHSQVEATAKLGLVDTLQIARRWENLWLWIEVAEILNRKTESLYGARARFRILRTGTVGKDPSRLGDKLWVRDASQFNTRTYINLFCDLTL